MKTKKFNIKIMLSTVLNRASTVTLLLVLVGVVTSSTVNSEVCTKQQTVHTDKRMAGETFREIKVSGLLQCGKACARSKNCKSINFNRESLTCEMNWSNDMHSLVSEPAWDYIDKSLLAGVPTDPCSNVDCPLYSTCVPLKSGATTCAVTECQKFIASIPHVTVLNVCSLVGCTVKLICESGYRMVHPTGSSSNTTTTTCLPDGTWSPVTSKCDPAGCTSFASTYTVRGNWSFKGPDERQIYGQSRSYCENECSTTDSFVCVAYYFNKVSHRCNLQPHRVHDSPDYQQYYYQNLAFDEYIRDCA